MSGYLPFTFIKQKVMDLENALFFSLSDSVLKIPACVIRVLETDELGQLWFMIPKPSQLVYAFDKIFPVKLDFFRKGRNYYLQVLGKAFLVIDPEEINSVDCLGEATKKQARENGSLLLKVQITHADYSEKSPEKNAGKFLINQVKNKIYQWFKMSQPEGIQKIPVKVRYPSMSIFSN